ncbi:DUF6624 domain-containing protein [Actinophytocola sp.]|uniref:DUF6624 domain-containing protein n=1 Tax=Actinophytocola sp. TaxID=1872138 RepID=UPI002ED3B0BC
MVRTVLALMVSVVLMCSGFSVATASPADQVCEPALRAELLDMMAQDQYEQSPEYTGPWHGPERTDRLREIIAEYGWPTFRLVGTDGATAAWVIAQHSDHDPAFQQKALKLMRAAARAGQADPIELAYLTDRVAVNTGRLQIYGTQVRCVDGAFAPAPLVDPEHVDERRASVGLGPLQEYLDTFPDEWCADPTG